MIIIKIYILFLWHTLDKKFLFVKYSNNIHFYSEGNTATGIPGAYISTDDASFGIVFRTSPNYYQFHITCETSTAAVSKILHFADSSYEFLPTHKIINYQAKKWSIAFKKTLSPVCKFFG